jgi:hypothetical protein
LIHLELVGFSGSTGRLIFWIKVEDDPFATVVLEADLGTILRRKSELGSGRAGNRSFGPREKPRDEKDCRDHHQNNEDNFQHHSYLSKLACAH